MAFGESGENITALFMNPKTVEEIPEEPESNFPENENGIGEASEHCGEDHPVIKFFDFALSAAIPICEKSHVTPPDKATYDTFGRACINEAAWNYLPETSEETPKWMSLALAIGCMLIIFAPTALSVIEKQKERAKAEEIEEPIIEPPLQPASLPTTLPISEEYEKEITEPIV